MYAFKLGDYQHCLGLQLSAQNVRTLFDGVRMPNVPLFPEFSIYWTMTLSH